MDDAASGPAARLWYLMRETSFLGLFAGIGIAFLDAGAGAAVIAVAAAVLVVSQVWTSFVHYRRVMARAWPDVGPLPDDDDDW
ncbi:MAG TPA: hypothetical protein VFU10_13295 [Gaiellaceae bacterium]|nr:hypothetical protein [Gaiellaceae bacterium]